MLKFNGIVCLVLCHVIVTISANYNEELESSFVPYERDTKIEKSLFSVSPSLDNILDSNLELTELEKKILSNVKKITIIEFKNDNETGQETLPIVSFTNKDSIEDIKSVSKRAINPKYKSAAISFFGAILSGSPNGFVNTANRRGTTSFSRARGKRSVEGSL